MFSNLLLLTKKMEKYEVSFYSKLVFEDIKDIFSDEEMFSVEEIGEEIKVTRKISCPEYIHKYQEKEAIREIRRNEIDSEKKAFSQRMFDFWKGITRN